MMFGPKIKYTRKDWLTLLCSVSFKMGYFKVKYLATSPTQTVILLKALFCRFLRVTSGDRAVDD